MLRRFIDLPKLFDLLNSHVLFLPRLKELLNGDPFECYARTDYGSCRQVLESRALKLGHYAPGASAISALSDFEDAFISPRKHFEESLKTLLLPELKKAVWYLERQRFQTEITCTCWYRGDAESDAMWKIYANQLGVAITTTVRRLKHAFTCHTLSGLADSFKLTLAAIKYDDKPDAGEVPPWLIKRTAFDHEKEIRLYCDHEFPQSKGLNLFVKPSKLIQEITVTPFAKEWQYRAIADVLGHLANRGLRRSGHIPIRHSSHMDIPSDEWPLQGPTDILSALIKNSRARKHRSGGQVR